MYIVGMGLVKIYKALLRLARGTLSVLLLMSMSEAFSVPLLTLVKLCYTKALERSSLVPGPEAKSSSEITNPTSFTVDSRSVEEGSKGAHSDRPEPLGRERYGRAGAEKDEAGVQETGAAAKGTPS